MFCVVVGGGRVGATLATMLIEQKHEVRIIEQRREIIRFLHHELPTEVIFEGSATDPDMLDRVGMARAEVAAACTPDDADNLAFCYMARSRYNVPRTIARINNPRNAWLFDDKFHVDVAMNQAELMASLIAEEMSFGDMMTLVKIRRGQFAIVEEIIPEESNVVGMAIKDLTIPDQCVIAAIIRQGKVIVPRGSTIVESGDEVLAVADNDGAQQLAGLLNAVKAGNGNHT
jgi:trk system potassium uptake protein TrkA